MLTFSPATSADLPALAALAVETFTETFGHLYRAQDLHRHLETSCSLRFFEDALHTSEIVLAREDKTLTGYVKFGEVGLPVEHAPEDGEIHRLYVAKRAQAQGVGRQLMEIALGSRRLRAAPALYLGVWENNLKAQRFYARYGFTEVGEYPYPVGDHIDRELILCRRS